MLFAHEFFHLMQWNALLHSGNPDKFWLNWIESQGRFAPSAQYPELELTQEQLVMRDSSYSTSADRFLVQHLDTSYAELETDHGFKYDGALYWRFLYEQYGSMDIVRTALDEMPRHFDAGSVRGMKGALDAAFARVSGPFNDFEQSLTAHARANYALRLETGRCGNQEPTRCGGRYYDPAEMYTSPRLEAELDYDGSELAHADDLHTSYGMDFVEVELERAVHSQPLSIKVQSQSASARFNVQIWQLGAGYARPRPTTPRCEIGSQNQDGAHVYVIPQVNTSKYNRLAIIITRLDPDETAEPNGNYMITLSSAG